MRRPPTVFRPIPNASIKELEGLVRLSKKLGDRKTRAYWFLRLEHARAKDEKLNPPGWTHDFGGSMVGALSRELNCSRGHANALVHDLHRKRLVFRRYGKGVSF